MKTITLVYLLNATLLLLHEIESGFEREWEILKLPGKITGFLLLHIPILLALFYGLLEIDKLSRMGLALGFITGIGGMLPFWIHKIFVYRQQHFNLWISNILIYLNLLTGLGTLLLAGRFWF